ncbi:MAG: hypothetical protein QFX40_04570 [Archaeoglobales archaeon]|nr:hypothetical protein [Archaeoglobales archaeon]
MKAERALEKLKKQAYTANKRVRICYRKELETIQIEGSHREGCLRKVQQVAERIGTLNCKKACGKL